MDDVTGQRLDTIEHKIDALLDGRARQEEQLRATRERTLDQESRLRVLEASEPVAPLKARMDVIEKEVWTRQGVIAFLAGIAGALVAWGLKLLTDRP